MSWKRYGPALRLLGGDELQTVIDRCHAIQEGGEPPEGVHREQISWVLLAAMVEMRLREGATSGTLSSNEAGPGR